MFPLGGPFPDEDRLSLVFTSAHPCGVEIGATPDTIFPLRMLGVWSGCADGCPGGLALLRASVQRIVSTRSGDLRALHVDACEGENSEPRVKLKIMACGNAAPVWIDSDSELVVPAGPLTLEVWGPSNWIEYGRANDILETLWVDVQLKVTICPLECYAPRGILTTWLNYGEPANAAISSRTVLRPRRSRELRIGAVDTATGAPAVSVPVTYWNGDPGLGIGATSMGADIFSSNTPAMFPIGGFSHMLLALPAAGVNQAALMRWVLS